MQDSLSKYIDSLSPFKREVTKLLIAGDKPEKILAMVAKKKRITKADRCYGTYKSYITMSVQGLAKFKGQGKPVIKTPAKKTAKPIKEKETVPQLKISDLTIAQLKAEFKQAGYRFEIKITPFKENKNSKDNKNRHKEDGEDFGGGTFKENGLRLS